MIKIFTIIILTLLFLYMSPMILGALVMLFAGIIALSWNVLWFLVIGFTIYFIFKSISRK